MISTENIEIKMIAGLPAAEVVNPFYEIHGSKATAREIDTFFIARSKGGDVLGIVRFCIENNTPMLRSMRVHTEFRRQKVGLKLLEAFRHYLDQNRIKNTYCIPFTHLEDFYGRVGFKKVQEVTAPFFIQERIAEYRQKQMNVICMLRD